MNRKIIIPGAPKRIITKCHFCANPGVHSDGSGIKLCSNCAIKALIKKIGESEEKFKLLNDMIGNGLVCFGCCHSAADEKFPGKPSGERPCCFCIRNPEKDLYKQDRMPDCWYDGSKAYKLPMDCYHSIDMKNQIEMWCK